MKIKTIFLFGAGASHGSGGLNYLVPLGNQLFCDLKKHFPNTWGQLPNDVVSAFDENFEKGIEIVWNNYSNYISVLMQEMAVFFSKIVIQEPGINLYVKLVKSLNENGLLKKCVMSTLNYDCLIELAISNNKFLIQYDLQESDKESMLVCKLHGSCNFVLDGINATRQTGYTSGTSFNGNGLKPIQLNNIEKYCFGDNSLYPAMSIFMRNKPNQIGKPYIEAMQKEWGKWILEADKIFIVGVNPYVEDAHIWGPLAQTTSKLFFCGNKNAFTGWQTAQNRQDEYLGSSFENAIDKIISKLRPQFLNQA